jgi:hypothetical protein
VGTLDLDGAPRLHDHTPGGSKVDMGAYELQ